MNANTNRFFVYGTLKTGEVRAGCWPHPPRSMVPAIVHGALYDLGPYPALAEGNDRVLGELWEFADEHLAATLQAIDRIECFGIGDVDLYVRRIINAETLHGEPRSSPSRTREGREERAGRAAPGSEGVAAYAYFLADPASLSSHRRVLPNSEGNCVWTRPRGR